MEFSEDAWQVRDFRAVKFYIYQLESMVDKPCSILTYWRPEVKHSMLICILLGKVNQGKASSQIPEQKKLKKGLFASS